MLLISRLCQKGPLSITHLTEGTNITRQAVSKHLRVLELAGLAFSEKAGRETVWALEKSPLERARADLELIGIQWENALERLRAFVESDEEPKPPRS